MISMTGAAWGKLATGEASTETSLLLSAAGVLGTLDKDVGVG